MNYERFQREVFIKPNSFLDLIVGDPTARGQKTDNGSDNLDYQWTNSLNYKYSINDKHNFDPIFQLLNGEQRAIREIMMTPRSIDQTLGYQCIGYAAFVQKMSDSEFARWFAALKDDLDMITKTSKFDGERLVLIHGRLIDLIDFLDPRCMRVASKYRTRIEN